MLKSSLTIYVIVFFLILNYLTECKDSHSFQSESESKKADQDSNESTESSSKLLDLIQNSLEEMKESLEDSGDDFSMEKVKFDPISNNFYRKTKSNDLKIKAKKQTFLSKYEKSLQKEEDLHQDKQTKNK
jgi:hypothetical protein